MYAQYTNLLILSISIEYKRPTLRDVYKYVVPKYAHEWRFLGGLLHFDQAELDIIFTDFRNDSKECCRRLLSIWLDKSAHASWNQLISAIDEINQFSLICLPEITHQGTYENSFGRTSLGNVKPETLELLNFGET